MKNDQSENDSTPIYKVILVGEGGVGKTCIIHRYIENTFDENTKNTLGESFLSKTIEIDDQVISLEIWDTVGGEKYRSLSKIFFNGSSAVIFVYDITKLKTFEELKNYWYQKIKEELGINIGKIYFFKNYFSFWSCCK